MEMNFVIGHKEWIEPRHMTMNYSDDQELKGCD